MAEDASDQNEDSDNDGDYLDPSKDSDYELISKLRHGLIEANSLSGDEANYSELENLDYESGINQEQRMTSLSLKTTSASQNTMPADNDKIGNNSVPHCQQSTTNVRQYYR